MEFKTQINPFRPNAPVDPGMFVGREIEIRKLESALLQTKLGHAVNFMITGERGIGKTSLLDYFKELAVGSRSVAGEPTAFLVVATDIDAASTRTGLIKRIQFGLNKELGRSERARKWLAGAWEFVQRLEITGVGVKGARETDLELLVDEFAHSLAQTMQRVTTATADERFTARFDGLILMIDEADKGREEVQLGSFLKQLVERLRTYRCTKVMVCIAGLPDLHQVLLESHPSSLRLFEQLPISALSDGEVEQIIHGCLAYANERNVRRTDITDEAIRMLINLSEGYPHFVQQFGRSAFDSDQDGSIDEEDVRRGAFGKHGALEQIGDCYYRDDFYNKIQEESYRQVLRIMANAKSEWVTKAYIKNEFQGRDTTLDHALHALRDRRIIVSQEGQRGIYRLQQRGFALWIKLCATDSKLDVSDKQKLDAFFWGIAETRPTLEESAAAPDPEGEEK